jgi:cyclopropane fatty-acyl-phospholipid synthase-like methyltransferase
MDFFERQWGSYRAIVERDLMEHQAVATATATAIDTWLAARPADAGRPHLVDLGCGDLALLAPLLQRLPLASYSGLDLTAAVLPLAQRALGEVPYPSHWIEGDLLSWSQADGPAVDVIHSAFAIHHLNDAEKATFLEAGRRRIAPGGLFIWVDVFREPGESLAAYRERYSQRIGGSWRELNQEQREQVLSHIHSFDIPADRCAIAASAEAAGWQWQWAWQGAHQAEALAVLTPA